MSTQDPNLRANPGRNDPYSHAGSDGGGLVAVVLAAGEGARLRPLSDLRAKALCPVGNVALLDWALGRVEPHVEARAVNVHHHRDQLVAHLAEAAPAVHVSVEEPDALGTAGAVGALRDWIGGRDVLIVNSDEWSTADLGPLVAGPRPPDRPRLLVVDDGTRRDFDRFRFAGASVLPWTLARTLAAEPSGLWEACWRHVEPDLVDVAGPSIDCGTPARYLDANLTWSGGVSVIGAGARVDGEVVRSVVWPGAVVERGERLVDAIRADDGLTVWARRAA